MPFEELTIGNYKFGEFTQERYGVTFQVTRIDEYAVTRDDETKINSILKELGKWENVVKAGLYLLSELKLITVDATFLHEYEKRFDSEIYQITAETTGFERLYFVRIMLSQEEGRRRTANGLGDILQLQEIYDQLKNVPKWEALQKALKITRENL